MAQFPDDQLEKFLNASIRDSTSSFRLFLASRGYAGQKVDRYTVLEEFVVFTDLQWHRLELADKNELYVDPL
jgi:hypothetical protein